MVPDKNAHADLCMFLLHLDHNHPWYRAHQLLPVAIMQLPPRQNHNDLYAILNWFSED